MKEKLFFALIYRSVVFRNSYLAFVDAGASIRALRADHDVYGDDRNMGISEEVPIINEWEISEREAAFLGKSTVECRSVILYTTYLLAYHSIGGNAERAPPSTEEIAMSMCRTEMCAVPE